MTQIVDDLRSWLVEQRWYGSKTRAVTGLEVFETIPLTDELALTIVEARFATGTHELYQLMLTSDRDAPHDVVADPAAALELLRRIDAGDAVETDAGRVSFNLAREPSGMTGEVPVRAIGGEQSNTSIVFDERLVLKLFRRLEAGINPDLEMVRFLTAREFEAVAPLHGWFEYDGPSLAATLGIAQEFIPDGRDGWELALDELAQAPDAFLERAGELGKITAEMHNVLASDSEDPAFSPEQPSVEALGLLTATIDEDIERLFVQLPEDERLAPILGRGQDIRERLAARAQVGSSGRQIRIHGDYHLGQTLATPRGWMILDFEGEPARPLPERRMKRSPLRDVASMLRSFAYAGSSVALSGGGRPADEVEGRARELFLDAYLSDVDPTLLPAGDSQIANLLAIFELEKAIYELRYELDNRPDWVPIPVAGIRRLLETG
ncbi:MAG: maltokinase N-terminal cap-like domain-containing protein [Solirubrobacteraceae bacterium]